MGLKELQVILASEERPKKSYNKRNRIAQRNFSGNCRMDYLTSPIYSGQTIRTDVFGHPLFKLVH